MERNNFLKILGLSLAVIVLAVLTVTLPRRIVTTKRAAFGTVNLLLQPGTMSVPSGEEKLVNIYIDNPAGLKVSFVDIKLSFDKTKLEITHFVSDPTAFPTNLTGDDPALLGRDTGQASLQALNSSASLPSSSSILVGTITLKGKAEGVSAMTIMKDISQIVGENPGQPDKVIAIGTTQDGNYTVTPGGQPTVTPTVPPGQPVLNFTVKFQGITQKRADQKVKVRVQKGGLDKTFEGVTVVADDSGVYSGKVTLVDVPPDSGYKIFIKGPKHLAKKFCQSGQTERCVGEGNITLVVGENNMDFSGEILEAGDVPDPNDGGRQNGVVNSVDYSLVQNRIGSSLPEDLVIADLNLDEIVNSVDVIMLRNTLETKYEEDY